MTDRPPDNLSPRPPWRPTGIPSTYPYPDVPATRLLDDAAKDFPDTVAIDSWGHRLTYVEVLDQVDRLATGLRRLGVGSRDRVGLLLPQCPQYLIAFFGTLRAGATVVLLDPDSDTLGDDVTDTGCSVVVCLAPWYERLEALKDRLPTLRQVLTTGFEDYLPFPRNILLPATGRRQGLYRRTPRTEGVTGFKDLIRRTAAEVIPVVGVGPALIAAGHVFGHRELVAGAFQVRLAIPDVQAGAERLWNAAPASSAFAATGMLGLGVLAAATIVYPPRLSVPRRRGRRVQASLMLAAPDVYAELVDTKALPETLRVGLGSGPVDPDVASAAHVDVGARLRGGFAPPEVAGLAHADPVYGRTRPGSAGRALTDTRTAALGPEGEPLTAGDAGVVAVRGPQTAVGRTGAGSHASALGGWVRTGVRGRLDADGYLWLEPGA